MTKVVTSLPSEDVTTFHKLMEKPTADISPAEAAYILYIVERAREDFATFCFAVSPGYEFPHHIQVLCSTLTEIEHTPDARVMVTCPPRHGKSFTCSTLYPAWYLGKNPEKKMITASYIGGLTSSFASQVRDTMEGKAYSLIFPNVKIKGKARGSWGIAGHRGGLMATGVTSSMTGFGADIMIIDDPIRDAMYADSPAWRQHLWDWFASTAYTRLHPGAPVFVIACMTGDTPVLMADGSERPLATIKVNDEVATYEDGELRTAKVLNHKSNGNDKIYEIMMTSGKIVRANERHPFLVDDHGELKWLKVRDLHTAQRIVTLKDHGASGKGNCAPLKDVASLSFVGDIAATTISKPNGQVAIGHLAALTRLSCEIDTLNTDTELLALSMTPYFPHRMDAVPFVESYQTATSLSEKMAHSALTTITRLVKSEGCYAMIATSPLATSNLRQVPSNWLNTSAFTSDPILSIEPIGIEEVFDVEIERTGNFIANGLVSHNTRWHHDDLSGRLIEQGKKDPDADQWTEIYFPAINDKNEALWPGRYDLKKLQRIKATVGSRVWNALYQGRPTPDEGNLFKRWMFRKILRQLPNDKVYRFCRFWDKAGTADGGDWTAGVLLAVDEDNNIYICHVVHGQWSALEREQIIRSTAEMDAEKYSKLGKYSIGIEQEPGSGGLESAQNTVRRLAGFRVKAEPPKGSLEVRADMYAAYLEAGNGYILTGDWNEKFIDEHCQFPLGEHDDQISAAAGAFGMLTGLRSFKYALLG